MQAEKYVATGNIASEGMRNQLGRPRLDRLSLLVRESAQNSWDAKAPRRGTVKFGIAGWTLTPSQFDFLRKVVFANRPPSHATDSTEAASLGSTIHDTGRLVGRSGGGLTLLAIYDRGTTGLGGPTRADRLGELEDPRDFVDFFRNVGTPPDKAQGGGTFGYGKAALYLASSAHTILVHTRTKDGRERYSRFMGSGLTNHYSHEGGLYTGRHWWGRRNQTDGIVDPIEGDRADEIAEALGFPGYTRNTLGTTIGIVAPEFGEWSPLEACEYMAWQMVLNFWPKMIPWPNEDHPRMRFELSWNGSPIEIPDPESTPPFDGFVQALQKVRAAELEEDESLDLKCLRPKKLLGRLGLEKCYTRPSRLADFASAGTVPDIHSRSHHVALLRRPELVVEYRSFGALPSDAVGYAGVFLADDTMDRVYAGAEPPTHDSWNPTILNDKRYRTFVRTTFKRIDEAVKEFTGPVSVSAPAGEGGPLASFADQLGSVLIGIEGPGASIQPARRPPSKTGKGRPKRAARPKVDVRDTGRMVVGDGRRIRLFEVDVRHAKDSAQTDLEVDLGTALVGGGVERDPPIGAQQPEPAFWRDPAGNQHEATASLRGAAEGTWQLGIFVPGDALVSVDVVGRASGSG